MNNPIRTTLMVAAAAMCLATPALAQNADNPECLGNQCGAPQEQGGGCGCGCGCSVWVAQTDDGVTLSFTDDADGDGRADDRDNCPFASNRDQADNDGDGVGNACDNCAAVSNFQQIDADGDGMGDDCDADKDADGVPNTSDNCAGISNRAQLDADVDGIGDACDPDDDGDGVADGQDNCPLIANPAQNQISDPRCNVDSDRDNVGDGYDNCSEVANPDQLDTDSDAIGNACDLDLDNDGVPNEAPDNCPAVANRDQRDDDGDGVGDVCDSYYCVVIDKENPDACLDPKAPFEVSAGASISLKRGQTFQPTIFANRNGAAMEYVWTVTKRPEGSKAAIERPAGAVTMSRHWQYAYPEGEEPKFTADVDGDYELQLTATLAFPDRVHPTQPRSSSAGVKVNISGSSLFACAAVPTGPLAVALAAVAVAMARRKRR